MHLFKFLLEALKLLFAQPIRTARASEHQSAGWTRGVVDQRFIPSPAGIVDIDRVGGRFHWREAVPVVRWIEEFEMQDRRFIAQRIALEAAHIGANAMLPADRPAVRAG